MSHLDPRMATAPTWPEEIHTTEIHNHVLEDEFHWIGSPGDARVVPLLEAENAYADTILKPFSSLRESFVATMKSMFPDRETSPFIPHGPYEYYTSQRLDDKFPAHFRRLRGRPETEEIVFDPNLEAQKHAFFVMAELEMSPCHRYAAIAIDTEGRERCTIRVRDMTTGEWLEDEVPDHAAHHGLAWAPDSGSFFHCFVEGDLRPVGVRQHRLGSKPSEDVELYREADASYFLGVEKTRNGRWLFVVADRSDSSELHVLDFHSPEGKLRCLEPRAARHRYEVDADASHFYIRTNWNATQFRLMRCAFTATGKESWEEFLPEDPSVYLFSVSCFQKGMVLQEKHGGLLRVSVATAADPKRRVLEMGTEVQTTGLSTNAEFATDEVLLFTQGFLSPTRWHGLNLETLEIRKVHEKEVPHYRSEDYESERILVPSHDGVLVPLDLLRKKGTPDTRAAFLYGYGSYGYAMDPFFVGQRWRALLDAGLTVAVAHPRGGSELGRTWYDDGKMRQKKNTFYDFIACAEYLVKERNVEPRRLAIAGGSAGGLLVGACLNFRPDLFGAVVAQVPFVDLMNTMLDDTQPLTQREYTEWGNSHVAADFEYMLSYSPYDNLRTARYPNILAHGSYHDTRVYFWEPVKWVQRIRRLNRNPDAVILSKTEMSAGHAGGVARDRRLKEQAEVAAFVLASVLPEVTG